MFAILTLCVVAGTFLGHNVYRVLAYHTGLR